MQEVLDNMNESRREPFLLPMSIENIETVPKVKIYRERLESGFSLRTRGEITTLPWNRATQGH